LFTIVLVFVNVQTTSEDFITVLDVGQGMSVVVGTSEFTMLIDCGSSSTNKAGEIAHEYLIGLGRTKLDVMVITHFHSDHINGIEFLLSRMSVSTLFIPDPDGSYHAKDIIELARKQQTDIIYVNELHEISIVDLQIFIYPPMGFSDENERGISVLTTGCITALIIGDMGQSTERSLMRYANLPKLDLLVVGHHGSRNSTSIELLQELKPDIAIIPVGRNSFGHPHVETLTRLSQANVNVYRTDELGHVTVVGN
jgi:competence protein ComEC